MEQPQRGRRRCSFVRAPYVGRDIATILTSGGYMAMGAALMVILRNLYERFRLGFEGHRSASKASAS